MVLKKFQNHKGKNYWEGFPIQLLIRTQELMMVSQITAREVIARSIAAFIRILIVVEHVVNKLTPKSKKMKNFKGENNRLKMERLQQLIISAKIEKDKSVDKLIGGFSQSLSIGNDDTIGQTNNCDGVNCRKYCGADIPQLPYRS